MKHCLHLVALLLFALTQLVAPFAHAHVDGVHRDAGIHTSDLPHHLLHSELTHCHIESHESQAIGPQQEYQRDVSAIIPTAPVAGVQQLSAGLAVALPRHYDPAHPCTIPYHRPHPQAPPA
jgi:hypothetical protein